MKPVTILRNTLLSIRDLLISGGPVLLLAVGLLVLAYWWLDPNPPKKVTLATGPAQSAYEEFGKRYQKALKAYGIEVVLVPSEGSPSNLKLLRAGKADIGFVQGAPASAMPTRKAASFPWAACSWNRCGCSTAPRR